jgi:hypothetical protein
MARIQPTKAVICVSGFFHSIASSVSMVLTSMNLAYNINAPFSWQIWATLVSIGVMILTDSIKTSLVVNPPQCVVPDPSMIHPNEEEAS